MPIKPELTRTNLALPAITRLAHFPPKLTTTRLPKRAYTILDLTNLIFMPFLDLTIHNEIYHTLPAMPYRPCLTLP